jgi:hypothetical protein
MTRDAMKRTNRLKRLNPKAWIGYLVGRDSTNIYRIWNPILDKGLRTRDVVFNEVEIYERKEESLEMGLAELQELINTRPRKSVRTLK